MSGPFDYFVLFAEMRTGSNFLESNLNALGDVACFGEAFNPHFIGYPNRAEILGITREERDAAPEKLIAAIRDVPGTLGGFRYFHDHGMDVAAHHASGAKMHRAGWRQRFSARQTSGGTVLLCPGVAAHGGMVRDVAGQRSDRIRHAATIPTSAGRASRPISSKDNTGFGMPRARRMVRRKRRRRVEVTTAGYSPC